ncbi:MAG: cardiolipin synthase [Lachnospiraceae bacterium]|nr:cardiolipin synthase [Lachnospiraceae bacterium]
MSKWIERMIHFLTSRMALVALAIILQVIWIVMLLTQLIQNSVFYEILFNLVGLILVVYIVQSKGNPAYKLSWTILIFGVPILGGLLYLIFGREIIQHHYYQRTMKMRNLTLERLKDSQSSSRERQLEAQKKYEGISNELHYIWNYAGHPAYENTKSRYFPEGEAYFESLFEDLKNARKFIFLEYFIVNKGYIWSTLYDILLQKVEEGVEVRFLYDDVGCIQLLPRKFDRIVSAKGIQCRKFNAFIPIMSAVMNNRNHQKVVVIDGRIGYTGGINLADEYANRITRFGHWKDCGIRLEGPGVENLTAIFLSMWNLTGMMTEEDLSYAFPPIVPCPSEEGIVVPYGDSPLDGEQVGESVYLNFITRAEKTLYIMTPYLIVDNETMTALCLAAKRGVDVRICMPHIPDKKLIFMLSRSYYGQLMEAGVRIFEYMPGFLHSKCFLRDNRTAVVGTINLDYRSLYLHFECGVFLHKARAVEELAEDFTDTFAKSMEITEDFLHSLPFYVKILQSFMRIFAPLF